MEEQARVARKVKVFWSTYEALAKIVVNVPDVDRLLNVQGDWSQVGTELEAVTGSCQLGMSTFGFALSRAYGGWADGLAG